MTIAQIDNLELELRKLDGVRTVGFSNAHDTLYIQLFVNSKSADKNLPFEATRIAKRYSTQSVAVELVRATFEDTYSSPAPSQEEANKEEIIKAESKPSYSAGTIGGGKQEAVQAQAAPAPTARLEHTPARHADFFRPTGNVEPDVEIDLTEEEAEESATEARTNIADIQELTPQAPAEKKRVRIELLSVTTSPENDEIEIHLSLGDTRTIGRAPSSRGLLGAIDATVEAISELAGVDEFHGEWARSLEPGAEHASLVAVGLINEDENETRHGIAGGSSPIEAAARATLNALNRIAALAIA